MARNNEAGPGTPGASDPHAPLSDPFPQGDQRGGEEGALTWLGRKMGFAVVGDYMVGTFKRIFHSPKFKGDGNAATFANAYTFRGADSKPTGRYDMVGLSLSQVLSQQLTARDAGKLVMVTRGPDIKAAKGDALGWRVRVFERDADVERVRHILARADQRLEADGWKAPETDNLSAGDDDLPF